MRICDEGCLNYLVKSVAEGGVGFPEWIVGQISNHTISIEQITQAAQNSGFDTINWVNREIVEKVFNFMLGNTFNGVKIAKFEDLAITVEYLEGTRSTPKPTEEDAPRKRGRPKKETE